MCNRSNIDSFVLIISELYEKSLISVNRGWINRDDYEYFFTVRNVNNISLPL